MKLRTSLKNKVNNILSAHGINLEKEALSSEKKLNEILAMRFDPTPSRTAALPVRTLEENCDKSRGGVGGSAPIMATPFSLWTGAGTDPPVCGSRAPVRALVVVETEVAIQSRPQVRPAGEVAGVDELVLEAAPQARDE